MTTLTRWLGSTARAVDPRSLSPIRSAVPSQKIWGLLGAWNGTSYEELQTNVITPLVSAWGLPDRLLLPAEGDAAQVLQRWATMKDIPVRFVGCDWRTLGRRAGLHRDTTIQQEASHMILLQGPRSNALTSLAARLKRKGRPVGLAERPGVKIDV
jgi:hypothetical protein